MCEEEGWIWKSKGRILQMELSKNNKNKKYLQSSAIFVAENLENEEKTGEEYQP